MEQTEKTMERHRNPPELFTQQWNNVRGQMKAWWDRLTDADLELIAGNKTQLVRVIQERYGYARQQAEAEVDRRLRDYYDKIGVSEGGSLGEKVSATAQGMASNVAGTAAEVGARVQDMATKAATTVADTATRAGAHLPDVPGDLVGFIRRYPVPSLLAGMGLGFLLARLFGPGQTGIFGQTSGRRDEEAGYPDAMIQCSRCGQMIRQADIVHHSTVCSGTGVPGYGGSPA